MGIFLALLVLLLARDIITLLAKKKEKAPLSSGRITQIAKKSFQDYAPVARNNPFGPPGELKMLTAAAAGKASAARPDISALTLMGTVSGPRKYSYAIFIQKGNTTQDLFRVGDRVYNFGVLQKIEKDKVFIKNGGSVFEVPVADLFTVTDTGPAQSAAKPAGFARNVGEGSYIIDQRRVQQAIERPNQIMTDARLLPNTVDGKQQGFVLSEVKPGGIYSSLGLQNGDVLLRINDYGISNPESALQAFTALRGMDRVQLDILRNGARISMTYQIK
ncbi:MAG TPA: type II secretion system protein GspC [Dissulfurispiraceae bacterium]